MDSGKRKRLQGSGFWSTGRKDMRSFNEAISRGEFLDRCSRNRTTLADFINECDEEMPDSPNEIDSIEEDDSEPEQDDYEVEAVVNDSSFSETPLDVNFNFKLYVYILFHTFQ